VDYGGFGLVVGKLGILALELGGRHDLGLNHCRLF